MANINIRGLTEIDDPAYRYKMPKVKGKVEGRGNGVKTRIVNIIELAASLHREPGEVCKFFGCELGSQTKWVEEEEKALVNGSHNDQSLQELVFRYIQAFVLCPNCKLPETEYKIKNDTIFHKCFACGAKEMVDMGHKLTTYIVGNVKKAKLAKKAKKSKEEKKKKKKKTDEDCSEAAGTPEKKKDKDKKEKKSAKKKKKKEKRNSDNEEGSGSGSGGEENSQEELVADVENLQVEDAGAFDTGVESIRRYIDNTEDVPMIMEELRIVQTFSAFPAHFRVYLLLCAIFAEGSVTEELISSKADVLKAVHNGNPILMRHMIGGLELLVANRRSELKPLLPVILKHLFDNDILEEEVILEWADDETVNEFRYLQPRA